MTGNRSDPFHSAATITTALGQRTVHRLDALRQKFPGVDRVPTSIKVLLESCLRNLDGYVYTADHVAALAQYNAKKVGEQEIPFMPGRVILQDFTGVPCVVDLAAMRSAMVRAGGDPRKVNPLVPCDLVIDHSVQVDAFNSGMAVTLNAQKEFERNAERYTLLKWAQGAFDNFRVVPPATGIVHQVNLEYLARVVWEGKVKAGDSGAVSLYPDSLVGTDSHTTMINGLGVVGWGVGGIEAEAVMLGQPLYMLIPPVVGMRLHGRLPDGATATDLVLVVTQILRKFGVVNKFVEFFGPGLDDMPVANRATLANMAPEYGATIGFFPVDDRTLEYMRLTGRDEKLIETVAQYYKMQGLWRPMGGEGGSEPAQYSDVLELDLGTVEPSLAGPKRPQDRVALTSMKATWLKELPGFLGGGKGGGAEGGGAPAAKPAAAGAAVAMEEADGVPVMLSGNEFLLRHGAVVIAAITSCTNTSNPDVMIAAGLVARKAAARGLKRQPWVKTSLAPGSKVVTEYLHNAGLSHDLEQFGFYLVGYGCTTCIGNSGPLPPEVADGIQRGKLIVASVLSGNRNFEGRVHPEVKANYLASPPLVVAYAIAGTVNIDLSRDPLGTDEAGKPVYLRDIWPTQKEIADVVAASVRREDFVRQYADVFAGSAEWKGIPTASGGSGLYTWDSASTYIQEPPFFTSLPKRPAPIAAISGARCLVRVGDSVTTDHISPAGSIKKDSPAGKFLLEHGVGVLDFNSYGSRRGNDRVMTRGTYANVRVRNQLSPGKEGGWTTYFGPPEKVQSPESSRQQETVQSPQAGAVTSIYEAACAYQAHGTPLIVLAGKDYGMGSSRDWAAKGVFLLGVRAVIAESFERIHRSNLVGMGVLPLCFLAGQTAESLGLMGDEVFDIEIDDRVRPRQEIRVTARPPASRPQGKAVTFNTLCRIDAPVEIDYFRNGGILQTVLRRLIGG